MKKFIILLLILSQCSFDNKTGIWKNNSQVESKKDNRFKDFETLYTKEKSFDLVISPNNNFKTPLTEAKINLKWTNEFYRNSNNLENFSYKNLNTVIFKSKKLSRHKLNEKTLFDGNNIIINNIKGDIIVYSVSEQKIIYKYNFYKKKHKKLKKVLRIVNENNIIYAADNLGYLYAINYIDQKILWAKNYKIPFRSNLKLQNDKLIIADQNNSLYLINKYDGEIIKKVPTEETTLKNDFINSISNNEKSVFYLNTYGSLYSININDLRINWFVNLNQTSDLNLSNLFFSNPLTLHNNLIVASTDPYLYILNSRTGNTVSKTPMTSIVKPIVTKEGIFLITKDNLLVYIDFKSEQVMYSLDITKEIAAFLDTKEKTIKIKSFSTANNNIIIFLENSYLVKFDMYGKINDISKLPIKMNYLPIFINDSILYFNKNNKLVILN